MKLNIQINQNPEMEVQIQNDEVWLEGKKIELDSLSLGKEGFHVLKNGKAFHVEIQSLKDQDVEIKINGKVFSARVKGKLQTLLESLGMNETNAKSMMHIKAPMPGLILKVLIEKGNMVQKGDPLLILEAMKMENIIKASETCTILEVLIKPGQKVEKGQNLVTLG